MKTVTLTLSDSQAFLLVSTINTAAQARYSELNYAEKIKAGPLNLKSRAQAMQEAEELLRVVRNSIDSAA